MDPYLYEIRPLPLREPHLSRLIAFLSSCGLRWDPTLTRYLGVYRGDRLVAGGGIAGRVIKCVAVDPDYRGEGLLGALIARLRAELAGQPGPVFLFTKPDNGPIFADLGFALLERTDAVLLMTSDPGDFSQYLQTLAPYRTGGRIGAAILNANPFTLGHQYLVESAAARCDRLLVFVVEEDLSEVPFDIRLRLVQEGCAHLPQVSVLPGGDYIISQATFPTYFLQNLDDASRIYTELDARIFAGRIAPAAGISVRFVGEEPFSPLTALYNQTMASLLPEAGIDLVVLPRKKAAELPISASHVRALLARGDLAAARPLLPDTTYQFFTRPEAQPVLSRIRAAGKGVRP